MRHSIFDFALDLKNIQTITIQKTHLNFVLFFINVLLYCFSSFFIEKIIFSFQNVNPTN